MQILMVQGGVVGIDDGDWVGVVNADAVCWQAWWEQRVVSRVKGSMKVVLELFFIFSVMQTVRLLSENKDGGLIVQSLWREEKMRILV